MRALGQWLFSVSSAGIVTALLTAAAPEKSRPMIRFAGGLLMILVALSPIRTIGGADPTSALGAQADGFADRLAALRGEADTAGTALMLREAERYLEERLEEIGCVCDIAMTAGEDGTGTTVFLTAEVIVEELPDPSVLAEAEALITSQTGVRPVFREKGGTE